MTSEDIPEAHDGGVTPDAHLLGSRLDAQNVTNLHTLGAEEAAEKGTCPRVR